MKGNPHDLLKYLLKSIISFVFTREFKLYEA